MHAVVKGEGRTGVKVTTSRCKRVGDGHIDVQLDPRNVREVYRDEYTNEISPPELIGA